MSWPQPEGSSRLRQVERRVLVLRIAGWPSGSRIAPIPAAVSIVLVSVIPSFIPVLATGCVLESRVWMIYFGFVSAVGFIASYLLWLRVVRIEPAVSEAWGRSPAAYIRQMSPWRLQVMWLLLADAVPLVALWLVRSDVEGAMGLCAASYWAVALTGVVAGNGLYWAWMAGMFVRRLYLEGLDMELVGPEPEAISGLSRLYSLMAFAAGLMIASAAFPLWALLDQSGNTRTLWLFAVLALVCLPALWAVLVAPQIWLSRLLGVRQRLAVVELRRLVESGQVDAPTAAGILAGIASQPTNTFGRYNLLLNLAGLAISAGGLGAALLLGV